MQPDRLNLVPFPADIAWREGDAGLALDGTAVPELKTRIDEQLALADEGYRLAISESGAVLEASTPRGAAHGQQTFDQLLAQSRREGTPLPPVTIEDAPRFSWRGGHLDVCRHFFPLETVKAYIDWLAWHKFNVFHWHLTEDQGWRLEIKKYPRLTEIGAWRQGGGGERYGGFYTQEEAREVVDYAAQRQIVVVPEIEVPGHAVAALAAYPELGCLGKELSVETTWGVFEDVYCPGKESVFTFLEDVFDEVCEIFPSAYIHVGGDECPKKRWETCPDCQKRISDESLSDVEALQSYTIRRVEELLLARGRKLIGWDEILEGGLAPQATVMSWRGDVGGITAAQAGHDVIMCPNSHCYLDHKQIDDPDETVGRPMDVCTLEKCYQYEPLPAALKEAQAGQVLGSQANVWTEYIRTPKELEYAVFPRLCALSEVFWSQPQRRDFGDFKHRLQGHVEQLGERGIDYCDKDLSL